MRIVARNFILGKNYKPYFEEAQRAKIAENYRYVFEKNRFENKSYGEIAEDMQISYGQ